MNNFKLYLWAMVLILLFALYEVFFVLFSSKSSAFFKFVAVLVFFAIVSVGLQRNTYLPFLGPTVLPPIFLQNEILPEGANFTFTVDMPEAEGRKVMYWGSQPSKTLFEDPYTAYGEYKNSGITTVKNGEAKFVVFCPSSYRVPGTLLSPHVHYRMIEPNGLLGEVKTVYVQCE